MDQTGSPYLYGILIWMKKTLHIDEQLLAGRTRGLRRRSTPTRCAWGSKRWSDRPRRAAARARRHGTAHARRPAPARAARGGEAFGGVMVLVDTSVWIRFLSNRAPYVHDLDDLLGLGEVSGHELVYGELLIGDKGGRRRLLTDYAQMHQAPLVPHAEVVTFVRARRLHGRGIGWVDVHLLASALVGRLSLWTADPGLAAVAAELGNRPSVTEANAGGSTRPHGRWPARAALLAVLLAASLLYSRHLGEAPVYLGWDEARTALQGYALATTGRDMRHACAAVLSHHRSADSQQQHVHLVAADALLSHRGRAHGGTAGGVVGPSA